MRVLSFRGASSQEQQGACSVTLVFKQEEGRNDQEEMCLRAYTWRVQAV